MPDTATTPPAVDRDPANEPAGRSDILFGAGQGAWLTLVTVVAGLALALSIVALLQDNGEGGGGGAVVPAGPATEVTFAATDFAFAPETTSIVADTDVPVTLENDGPSVHNWAILPEGESVSSGAELADVEYLMILGEEAGIGEGESVEDVLNLAPGSYQFVCTIAGHFDLGMHGDLTAQAA